MDTLPGMGPLLLTAQLAGVTVIILLLIGTPLAWWLAFGQARWRPIIEAIVALPLVLPPTVLGFYLLLAMGPNGPLGMLWIELTGQVMAFTFEALVLASVLYSMPFVVQPLQTAFEGMGRSTLEAAWTLGASPLRAFFHTAVPMCRRGFITAIVLGFAHTLGEFGVVLMVGGNIPGETRVVSIAVYDHVESLAYEQAHILSAILIGLSFTVLLAVYTFNRRWRPLG